ncbi:hypothetical protein B0H66DRAFT_483830 [Apodospora peruviana]|uniref:Oxidoreductase acuF-like C2H2 type zinc-finger domain-containing protein n=1 Tax=Apodospora peruviana TaxID=516989 RepID=A0AAE0HWQ0_9PEZI|nr:hypothetical protein B0H66DRAFT_483830 [Apodospora peruviana]
MDALADAGIRVAAEFEKVKAVDSRKFSENFHTLALKLSFEADRFLLWAVNLGLFVSGHASLDYRVRDAENIRSAAQRLISSLEDALTEVLDYFGNSSYPSQEVDSVEEVLPADKAGDGEDFDTQGGSDTDLLLEGVKDPIDRLFKLAVWIRNPLSRAASQKVLHYRLIDQESGVDLLDAFKKLDYDYVSSLFLEFQKSRARADNAEAEPLPLDEGVGVDLVWEPIRTVLSQYKQECSKGTESFLVHRMASANVRRRQQFAYWKNHRSKLVHHSTAAIDQLKTQRNQDVHAPIEMAETGTQLPFNAVSQSVTTASRLDTLRVAKWNDQATVASVSEYTASAWQPGKEELGFPAPPTHLSDGKFFECPYCSTLCSSRLLSDRAWRAHLIHDLRPYMCTYESCRTSDQLYDSIESWINHEESTHRLFMRCPEHPTNIFPCKDDFQSHLEAEHGNQSNDFRTALLACASKSVSAAVTRCCPICLATYTNTQELNTHIARHLERISLFSLPRSACDSGADDADKVGSSKPNQSSGGFRHEWTAGKLLFTDSAASVGGSIQHHGIVALSTPLDTSKANS